MKSCLRLLLPAVVLLLGLSTIASACGGDDEKLTLEEFFQQGQAIEDDFEQRFERLYEDYPNEDTEENFQTNKAYYGEYAVLYAEFIDELEGLNPPSEAEDAFNELLGGERELGEVLQDVADRIEGVESFAEAEQLLDEALTEYGVVEEQYQDACQSLRELADANGIAASFACGNREGE